MRNVCSDFQELKDKKKGLTGKKLVSPFFLITCFNLRTLELQKNSPKPKTNIIRETLTSVRTIVEGAAGGVASTLATEANLLQKIEAVNKSLS